MSSTHALRIAVDIGGTFTDGVAEDVESGRIWVGKTLTTPDDPGEAVSAVVDQLLARIGDPQAAGRVADVVHGTTLVTNTLIERKGVPTGLVVTSGTADTLDIRREVRYDLYDLDLELPEPLVGAEDRFEIDERLGAAGEVLRPLAEEALAELVEQVKAKGLSSVAVCLLHGHVNDAHESRVRDALKKALPNVSVSISSAVAREIREYERMSTTAANAYVQPLVETYLVMLSKRMQEAGIAGSLRIMLSSGGFTSADAAAETPILLLESGPAAGVLSAVNAGLLGEVSHVLAFDMGGTTAKACVAVDGAPAVAHAFEAARVRRFKRGSGLPIMIPSIDLIEIGAGGGSLASVDNLGLLKVGPQSAGSEPGPACYGRGGEKPTVTDADLVLGYLDPDNFLGGEMHLDKGLAEKALADLGAPIGLDATRTAAGIATIVNENMAAAARVHIAEKGHDPRAFTLVATGGAGPVHAVEVARRLGISTLLCPIAAGAGSCLGLLAAPARVDRSWSKPSLLAALDWNEAHSVLSGLHRDATAELNEAGADAGAVDWVLTVEMRYAGQGSTLNVTVPYGKVDESLAPALEEGFEASYRDLYGTTVPNAQLQTVTWRLTGKSGVESRRFTWAADAADKAPEPKRREIYIPVRQRYEEVDVWERYALPPGMVLKAPLVLEERESTLIVPADGRVEILPDLTVKVVLGETS
ncbi:hydantoinase/oxoprolinase family protein [Afifella sp. IM 167]|uniref:hydantoinase/oxoprolinase family protein n=1 Tax=Afifella sp. IM 167 TaxID=2033586 RepID=UPI001CCC0DD5|nr:hydantoinase/oxoprolinase family protein [Afifella sp. IM 167]